MILWGSISYVLVRCTPVWKGKNILNNSWWFKLFLKMIRITFLKCKNLYLEIYFLFWQLLIINHKINKHQINSVPCILLNIILLNSNQCLRSHCVVIVSAQVQWVQLASNIMYNAKAQFSSWFSFSHHYKAYFHAIT